MIAGIIISVILLVLGVAMIVYGVSDYEEGIAIFGVLVLVIGIFGFVFSLIAIDEEPQEQDRHVKVSYEDLCYEYGGEYLNLEGQNTCIVEE
jgi:drug/metabolite transporter (DMT)-like permease